MARYCSNCGSEINENAVVCVNCGTQVKTLATTASKRIAAALFAFFLGGFGVHKFYLGKTGQGILYLLFIWTGLPSIIGIIEGIIYLTKSDEEFNMEYGNQST